MGKTSKADVILHFDGTDDASKVVRQVVNEIDRVGSEAARAKKQVNGIADATREAKSLSEQLSSGWAGLALKAGAVGAAIYGVSRAVGAVVEHLEEGAAANTMQRQIDAISGGAAKVQAALDGLQNTLDLTSVQGFVLKMDRAGLSAMAIKDAMGFSLAYARQTGMELEAAIKQVAQAVITGEKGSFKTLGIDAKDTADALAQMREAAEAFRIAAIGDVGIAAAQASASLANMKSSAQQTAASIVEISDETRRLKLAEEEREQSLRRQADFRASSLGIEKERALEVVRVQSDLMRAEQELYAFRVRAAEDGEALSYQQRTAEAEELRYLEAQVEQLQVMDSNWKIVLANDAAIRTFWQKFSDGSRQASRDVGDLLVKLASMGVLDPKKVREAQAKRAAELAALFDDGGVSDEDLVESPLKKPTGGGGGKSKKKMAAEAAAAAAARDAESLARIRARETSELAQYLVDVAARELEREMGLTDDAETMPGGGDPNAAVKEANAALADVVKSQDELRWRYLDNVSAMAESSIELWRALGDISGSKKAVQVFKGFEVASLAILATTAGVKAAYEWAEGFAAAGRWDWVSAGNHWAAAAGYTAVAAGKAAQAASTIRSMGGAGRSAASSASDISRDFSRPRESTQQTVSSVNIGVYIAASDRPAFMGGLMKEAERGGYYVPGKAVGF